MTAQENTPQQPQDVASLSPETIEELYASAHALYQNGAYPASGHFFRLLAMADPDNPRHWIGLGAVHQMCQEYQDALPAYAMAAMLDQQKTNPYPHLHAAECFFAIQQKDSGFSALETAESIASKQKKKYKEAISRASALREAWASQTKD